jgi:prenyltransferase beta subunit
MLFCKRVSAEIEMIEAAIDLLLSAQNEDGGWGAVKGKRSNTESTSFALMALKSLVGPSMTHQNKPLGQLP